MPSPLILLALTAVQKSSQLGGDGSLQSQSGGDGGSTDAHTWPALHGLGLQACCVWQSTMQPQPSGL